MPVRDCILWLELCSAAGVDARDSVCLRATLEGFSAGTPTLTLEQPVSCPIAVRSLWPFPAKAKASWASG